MPPDNYRVERMTDSGDYVTDELHDFFNRRAAQGRHHLIGSLVLLNAYILVVGALLSYYLARRTLEPIEANMAAQARFVSDASHELRTPLTALQTTNEVALRRAKLTNQQARAILQENVEEVIKLKQLTDNLLQLARNESKPLLLAPVSLSDTVSDAINSVVNQAVAKRITIDDTAENLSVLADRSSLAQVLVILLDNAIKYSSEHSTVSIRSKYDNKHVIIEIADQGIGIKKADLPRIFERFYRADEARNKSEAGGYGIGLAIAKQMTEQLNGTIAVRSAIGTGSVFSLRLPLTTGK